MGFFILLTRAHLISYPCPLQINFFWNLGFSLGVAIVLQILTGLLLALHYTADLLSAFVSVFWLIREVYYGWFLRYFHSSGASFVFFFLFLHLGRGIFYGSYNYNTNTWFSGIILLFFLMAISFLGYVLPFGQMSFWGATVITNLLSPLPCLVEWICGGYCINNPTVKRFFLIHFVLPFILLAFVCLHLFYLHFHSSSNPLKINGNSKVPFFPNVFLKDFYYFSLILVIYFLQVNFGMSTLSHPDNAQPACELLTPLHIVPEWYFLIQYAMLKAVPNKNAGFIVLITSISIIILFVELRNLSSFLRLVHNNCCFSIISLFFINFSFLYFGAQFPQSNFLSTVRILTFHFYGVLIICILLEK